MTKKIFFALFCSIFLINGCSFYQKYLHYTIQPQPGETQKPGVLLLAMPAGFQDEIVRCDGAIRKIDNNQFDFKAQDSVELMPGKHIIRWVRFPGLDYDMYADVAVSVEEDSVYVLECARRNYEGLVFSLKTKFRYSDLELMENPLRENAGFRLKGSHWDWHRIDSVNWKLEPN